VKLLNVVVHTEIHLAPINPTHWELRAPYSADFITDEGVFKLRLKAGWITDLRSGTNAINFISPKWGNPIYMAGIFFHDTSFSGWVSFELCNDLLRQCCILSGECNKFQAWLVYQGVMKFGREGYHYMDEALPEPYENSRHYESLRLYDK
jgi:hypothetical protein